MPIESSRQAEQAVGIRRRGTNFDGRAITVKQMEVESLRLRSKPAEPLAAGQTFPHDLTRRRQAAREPFPAPLLPTHAAVGSAR
jgi:hypothetical protein